MSETTVQVSFGRPMPVFPLSSVTLLPHGVLPLHVFEPRYRQMVADAMKDNRQIAMATFHGTQWRHEYHGRPAIRPAVCIGVIVQSAEMPDGTLGILMQGLCRARIVQELPADDVKLYREAILEPMDQQEADDEELDSYRSRIATALEHDRLSDLRGSSEMLEHLKNPEIPTTAILEVLAFTFLTDQEARYKLLASDDPVERAGIVSAELFNLQSILRKAQPQRATDAPKGCHWN